MVIPDQNMTARALVDFSRPFGYLEVAGPDNGGHPEHPEILIVGNPPGMLISFSPRDPKGELECHTDHIHHREPARLQKRLSPPGRISQWYGHWFDTTHGLVARRSISVEHY